MKPVIIIEHLEPKMWPWCKMEYKSISRIIPRRNLLFTNIKEGKGKLSRLGKVTNKSVIDMELDNVCILDPNAPKKLTPKEAKSFKNFIIGGILGDHPPKKRTKVELTNNMRGAARNMGRKQLSTDNAVYVLKKIIDGTPLEKMKFQNKINLKINDVETIELPYYYPLINNKPRISKELIKYLKKKKGF